MMEQYIGFFSKKFDGGRIQSLGLDIDSHSMMIRALRRKVDLDRNVEEDDEMIRFLEAPLIFFEFYRVDTKDGYATIQD